MKDGLGKFSAEVYAIQKRVLWGFPCGKRKVLQETYNSESLPADLEKYIQNHIESLNDEKERTRALCHELIGRHDLILGGSRTIAIGVELSLEDSQDRTKFYKWEKRKQF